LAAAPPWDCWLARLLLRAVAALSRVRRLVAAAAPLAVASVAELSRVR
jgi:hypothetical protein